MSEAPAVLEFWPTIFHSFRAEDHKFLVVSTSNGLEVAVQEILRVEEGLVMIRGRIAGTADSGRLFLLPFAQLSSVYVNRPVRMEGVDLFPPRVAPARKLEVAKQVADLERRAREDARLAEAAKNGDVDLADTLKRLDTLRDLPEERDQPMALDAPSASSTLARNKSGRLPTFGNRAARLPAPIGEKTETKT
jgi:hypothetical protein